MATETQISRPAPFVEDIGKDLSKQVLAQTTGPIVTTGLAGLGTMAQPTQQAFETAEQFKQANLFGVQRAALGFEQKTTSTIGINTTGCRFRSVTTTSSTKTVESSSFQPFLKTQQLSGAGAGTGPQSVQAFMSPYQQQLLTQAIRV